MKTIVLDDDPTGTQSVTGVTVLLQSDADAITEVLAVEDAVYVQTNSRALSEAEAVRFVKQVRADGLEAGVRLGEDVRFVLRGDSTLRGHVFAETEVFLDDEDAIMLFVPAFPDGGRTTKNGVHFVRVGGTDVPAHESEYADDPVFPFRSGALVDYVAEKSARTGVGADLDDVRAGKFAEILFSAPGGSVVVPDAVAAEDIRLIAHAVDEVSRSGRRIAVRCASPLAAEIAGVASEGLLSTPLPRSAAPTMLVCGSHTNGATSQLLPVAVAFGEPAVIDTDAALADPRTAGVVAAESARVAMSANDLAFVATARTRSVSHNTLMHGEQVMKALTTAVRELLPEVSVVVSKGGITSADVARLGIGATRARVRGQVLPGISAWDMTAHDGREILYIVVPGNVGGPETLVDVLAAVGVSAR